MSMLIKKEGVTFLICTNLTPVTLEAQIYRTTACSRTTFNKLSISGTARVILVFYQ